MISIGAALAMAAAATMAGIVIGAAVMRRLLADEMRAWREDAEAWQDTADMWQRLAEAVTGVTRGPRP